MPLVVLTYKPDHLSEEIIRRLVPELTHAVADALDVPGNLEARLTPDDIEVYVAQSQSLDFNTKDLEILIWAHQYPERLQNLEERKDKILAKVHQVLEIEDFNPGITGWVWILLQPTAFGKIKR